MDNAVVPDPYALPDRQMTYHGTQLPSSHDPTHPTSAHVNNQIKRTHLFVLPLSSQGLWPALLHSLTEQYHHIYRLFIAIFLGSPGEGTEESLMILSEERAVSFDVASM
jgi:hypothetical protein